ncbi:hypothetical protein BS47DRAFT_1319086 [Hydnum rufescens UP504]|uniref:Large ribosomal subunit protein bL21m n=1 Tax=Hydnum rufescens UP504 TaxID=1448309 RepID=A0A9P6ATN4_9AGAM|nr:hypothetical protein BS47DRAFT_1319086 [Hydnum rufescens UP504]
MQLGSTFRQASGLLRPWTSLSSVRWGSSYPSVHVSTAEALERIRSESSQYVIANFLGRRYILSPHDLLTVPRIRDVAVGDIVSLSAIQELGSRQYTLRGDPVLPKGTVDVKAMVVEHTKGRMERIVKFKRRKGYQRRIDHKQRYTRLRIGPIHIAPTATTFEETNS